MGGSLLFKAEVPGSSLMDHLPKEFSLRLTWCPWLVGYYGTREINRGARKLTRTTSLSKKKKSWSMSKKLKIYVYEGDIINIEQLIQSLTYLIKSIQCWLSV